MTPLICGIKKVIQLNLFPKLTETRRMKAERIWKLMADFSLLVFKRLLT